ncbi:MAG: hypothetical protein ACM31C_22725 [Acidobacteriota bacterium]
MSLVRLIVRTWLRYLGPFLVLAVLATAPPFWLFFELAPTLDPAHAKARLVVGLTLALVALLAQLALVAAVAPATRAAARGAPLPQSRALLDGAAALAHAIVPTIAVAAAVVLGGLALVVPGLALLVLLSLTGASERLREPLPSPLEDSVDRVRGQFWIVAIVVAAAIAIDLAICDGRQLSLLGKVMKKPTAVQLAAMKLSRLVPIALAAVSPLVATALAACASRERT